MPKRGARHGAHRQARSRAAAGVRTISVRWPRVCVAVPVVVLIGVAIVLVARVGDVQSYAVTKDSTAAVVPGAAPTPTRVPPDPFGAGTQQPTLSVPPPAPGPTSPAPAVRAAARPPSPARAEPSHPPTTPAPAAPSSPAPSPTSPLPTISLPF